MGGRAASSAATCRQVPARPAASPLFSRSFARAATPTLLRLQQHCQPPPRFRLRWSAACSATAVVAGGAALFAGSTPHGAALADAPIPEVQLNELPEDAKEALGAIHTAKAKAKEAMRVKDMPAAEEAYMEALEAARQVDDMHVAGQLNNLAEICRVQGKLDASAAHLEEACSIMSAMYGNDHGLVGFLVHNLGRVRRQQKKLPEAVALFQQARSIRELTQEAEPLADTLWELGVAHRALKQRAEAAEALAACLAVSETLPLEVCDTRKLMGRRMALTVALIDSGDPAEAERVQRSAAAAAADANGAGAGEAVLARYALADTLAKVGQHAEAAALFGACVEARAARVGKEHRGLLPMLRQWERSLLAAGNAAEAADVRAWAERAK